MFKWALKGVETHQCIITAHTEFYFVAFWYLSFLYLLPIFLKKRRRKETGSSTRLGFPQGWNLCPNVTKKRLCYTENIARVLTKTGLIQYFLWDLLLIFFNQQLDTNEIIQCLVSLLQLQGWIGISMLHQIELYDICHLICKICNHIQGQFIYTNKTIVNNAKYSLYFSDSAANILHTVQPQLVKLQKWINKHWHLHILYDVQKLTYP